MREMSERFRAMCEATPVKDI
jgi:hypothetical protein